MKKIWNAFLEWLVGEEDFISDIKRNAPKHSKGVKKFI